MDVVHASHTFQRRDLLHSRCRSIKHLCEHAHAVVKLEPEFAASILNFALHFEAEHVVFAGHFLRQLPVSLFDSKHHVVLNHATGAETTGAHIVFAHADYAVITGEAVLLVLADDGELGGRNVQGLRRQLNLIFQEPPSLVVRHSRKRMGPLSAQKAARWVFEVDSYKSGLFKRLKPCEHVSLLLI